MKLLKYRSFLESKNNNYEIVVENLDQAKKLLRDTYKNNKIITNNTTEYKTDKTGLFLFTKADDLIKFKDLPDDVKELVKTKQKETKIDPAEIQSVEKGDILRKVRELVGDKLGYAYMFTYFLVVEKIPFSELKALLEKIIEFRDLLTANSLVNNKPLLRRPISNYIDPNVPNNYEQMLDDLEDIQNYKATKRIIAEMTPELKRDYESQPPVIKKQVEDLAMAFSKLGMEGDTLNQEVHNKLWKLFFGEEKILDEDREIRGRLYKKGERYYTGQMVRFKKVVEFVKSAQNFIKNIDNDETVKFYESIERCNDKFGDFGAKVMFDEGNILILDILSYQANRELNSHTRHCIKDSLSQWDSYVGGENLFNKQYYIYNFNLPSYDVNSVIGITIEPGQRVRACHKKDDSGVSKDGFVSILKKWEKEYGVEDLWSYFKPMSDKQIEEKKRRNLANKEIVKKGISIDKIRKLLLEDGADVNTSKGQALDNAIAEGDVEKVKFLLDYGASPNLRGKQEASINKLSELSKDKEVDPETSRKAFQILKYMLRAGAELTTVVFRALVADEDAVRFCLENGMDPNLERGLALRVAIRRGLINVLKLLIDNGASLPEHKITLAFAYASKRPEVVEFLVEKGLVGDIDRSMYHVSTGLDLDPKQTIFALKDMQRLLDEGKATANNVGYRITDPKSKVKFADLDYINKTYGNLYTWCIENNKEDLMERLTKEAKMSQKEAEEFIKWK